MNHQGTQVLETRRLVLRPFTVADATAAYTCWGSDPRVTRCLSWTPHPDVAYTRTLLTEQIARYSQLDFYYWAITLATTGELMGVICAKPSLHCSLLEPAYWLGFRYWSGGYMSEALEAVCRYLMGQCGAPELICSHDTENPASGRVMEKVGFRYAYDREYQRKDGTKRPCRCYLLGKEEEADDQH